MKFPLYQYSIKKGVKVAQFGVRINELKTESNESVNYLFVHQIIDS